MWELVTIFMDLPASDCCWCFGCGFNLFVADASVRKVTLSHFGSSRVFCMRFVGTEMSVFDVLVVAMVMEVGL